MYHSSSESVEIKSVVDDSENSVAKTTNDTLYEPEEAEHVVLSAATEITDFEPFTQMCVNEQVFSDPLNESVEDTSGDVVPDDMEESDEATGRTDKAGILPDAIDENEQLGCDSLENNSPDQAQRTACESSGEINIENDEKDQPGFEDSLNETNISSNNLESDETCKKSEREEYLEAIKELSCQKVDPSVINDPLGLLAGDAVDCEIRGTLNQDEPQENQDKEQTTHEVDVKKDETEDAQEDGGGDDIGGGNDDAGAEISTQDRTSTSEDFLSGKESLGGSTEDVSDIDEDVRDDHGSETGLFDEAMDSDDPNSEKTVGETEQLSRPHNEDYDGAKKEGNCKIS